MDSLRCRTVGFWMLLASGILVAGWGPTVGEERQFQGYLAAERQRVEAALDCVAGRVGNPAACLAFGQFGKGSAAGTWCGLPAAVGEALSVPGVWVECPVAGGLGRRWRSSPEEAFMVEREQVAGLFAGMRAGFKALPRVEMSEEKRAKRLEALQAAAEAMREQRRRRCCGR